LPRVRLISPEFWTAEAVVDCAPMARLLLLGLGNFADDFGVLPLRPRTLRLQVFPGDALDDDAMCAMLDELTAHGLLRRYTVDGVEYLAIVDWESHRRVGRRARRRYPALAAPDHGNPSQSASSALEAPYPAAPAAAPDLRGEAEHRDPPAAPAAVSDGAADAARHEAIDATLRRAWGGDVPAHHRKPSQSAPFAPGAPSLLMPAAAPEAEHPDPPPAALAQTITIHGNPAM
jgi:hypothetical protein